MAREAWSRVDLLLANADEIRLLAEDPRGGAAEAALKSGVKAVIWKRGAQGATCFTPSGQLHAPALEVPVTTTIGAGDGFGAGFIYAYAQGKPLTDCLRYGNACAALVVQEVGCAEAMPTLDRLEDFLDVERGALP